MIIVLLRLNLSLENKKQKKTTQSGLSTARDLVNPTQMPTPFEWRIQKDDQDFIHLLFREQPPGHREYVGIIMGTR